MILKKVAEISEISEIQYWLVVDLPLWKMIEFVNGKVYPIYYDYYGKKMFQTTNQNMFHKTEKFGRG